MVATPNVDGDEAGPVDPIKWTEDLQDQVARVQAHLATALEIVTSQLGDRQDRDDGPARTALEVVLGMAQGLLDIMGVLLGDLALELERSKRSNGL